MKFRALRSAIIVGSLIASAVTFADKGGGLDKRSEARSTFGQAMADYQRGEFRAALAGFHHGYDLYPDAAFLFNIGQCHRRLDEKSEAVRFYLLFLDAKPDAPNREEVGRYVERLEQEMAAVPVSPRPAPLPPPKIVLTLPPTPPLPPTRPIYRRWWLWTAMAAVVSVGVGLALGLTLGSPPAFHPTLPDFGPPAGTGFALAF